MIAAILIAYFHSKHFPRGRKGVVVRDCQSLKLEFLRTEKGEKINFFHFSKLPRGLQAPLISPAQFTVVVSGRVQSLTVQPAFPVISFIFVIWARQQLISRGLWAGPGR